MLLRLTLVCFLVLAQYGQAQSTCSAPPTPSSPQTYTYSLTLSTYDAVTERDDIAAQEPFSFSQIYCPVPPSPVGVLFTLRTNSGAVLQSGTVSTDPTGAATYPVTGLPLGAYTMEASSPGLPGVISPSDQVYAFSVDPGDAPSLLAGQYAFLAQGTIGLPASGVARQAVIAGSFVADGQGNLVSGEADVNSAAGSYEQLQLAGSYTLSVAPGVPGARGTMLLNTVLGKQSFSILTPLSGYAAAFSAARSLTFTALPSAGFFGSGVAAIQNAAAFAQVGFGNGDYYLSLTGESACDLACAAAGRQAMPATMTGTMSATFNEPQGEEGYEALFDETIGTTVRPHLQQFALGTSNDSSGRTVFTTPPGGTAPGAASRLATYQIDATHFYVLSLDPHTEAPIFSGTAYQVIPPAQ